MRTCSFALLAYVTECNLNVFLSATDDAAGSLLESLPQTLALRRREFSTCPAAIARRAKMEMAMHVDEEATSLIIVKPMVYLTVPAHMEKGNFGRRG